MILSAENLVYTHPGAARRQIDGVSFEFAPGTLTALLGRNGSGKSTLVKLLSGYLTPESGAVSLDGRPVSEWAPRDRAVRLAVVQQTTPAPLADFTVREIVSMGLNMCSPRFGGPLSVKCRTAIDETLARLALREFESRPASSLSGGEWQRVMTAAALVRSPGILLMDEPTSAADPAVSAMIMRLVQSLRGQIGILIVTHDLQLALDYADRAILLHDGRIAAAGPPSGILTPDLLRSVYGCEFQRTTCGGRPVILPQM